jgi:hypothetical protein
MQTISYDGYRFRPELIRQAIWLYLRFTLSLRDIEDLLAERGLIVSYETVRRPVNHFGPRIAAELRGRRPKPSAISIAVRRALPACPVAGVNEGDSVILITDANSQVAPNWIAENLAAIEAGAEAVLGRINLDGEGKPLSQALHRRGRLEDAYERLLTELSWLLDRKTRDSGRKPVEGIGYLTGVIRLRDKLAALWQKLQLAPAEPRRDNDLNRRPSSPHRSR